MSKYILGVFLFLLCLNMTAQEPGMWHITDKDGLPSNTVYHTVQDDKGFIWIGTEKGICRFNGEEFKTYKSDELNDNEILKIEIDPLGRVWFRNLSGQLFYIENETIHNTQDLFPKELSIVNDFIIDDHTIWFTFRTGAQGYENFKLTRLSFNRKGLFTPLYTYSQKFAFPLGFQKSNDSIYIFPELSGLKTINNDALILLDKKSNNLETKDTMALDRITASIYYFLLDGELYLISTPIKSNQTSFLKRDKGKTKSLFEFKKRTIFNDLQKIDNQLWILTNNGILINNILGDQLVEHTNLLSNKSTNYLMIDHEGNKWISTTGSGIHIITAPQTQTIQTSNFNLPNNEIICLEYDYSKRKLLIGHSKGQISCINDNLENEIIKSDPSGRVIDFMIDQSGNYWIVNEREIVVLPSSITKKNRYQRRRAGIKTLLEAKNKDIWVGAFHIAYRIPQNKIKEYNTSYEHTLQYIEKIISNRTYALYQDYAEDIWIGTSNGLFIYRDTVQSFLEKGEHTNYNISSITQSVDSVIWIATRGNGLIAIKDNKVIQRIEKENGLASNTIKKIFSTPHHLWVATDNGVNKINLKSKETEWINSTDGLPSNDVNDIIVVDSQVWVATSKGLANFSINAQHKNNTPPPIYISSIKLSDKDTIVHDSFILEYDQNNIQIDMVGLGYKGKGDISYEYKLSGLEEKWVQTSSKFTRYLNLSPGEYRFDVFAINEDQVKSIEPASVYFCIQPPWWKTWWFRALCFLSVGGTIAYFMNVRKQRQQQEQRFLDHVKELKTKALRSQMNPHFIFNSLNAIQRFLTTNDREQAINYLSSFGKLIRLVFDHSQLEKISLEEEIDFLKLYLDLEKLRFMDAINIQLEISPFLLENSDEIHLPPLLIQPIIENSFKHGFLYKKELGILSIKFSREGSFLTCDIQDNGIGRKKAAELGQVTLKDRPSSGLKTSKERLKILKQNHNNNISNKEISELNFIDLYDVNGNVSGTLVKIKIYCSDLEPIN